MVNLDQAQLLFQMIIAQHADKTWGEVRELLGVKVNQLDKNIKMCESKCENCAGLVVVDHEYSNEYMIGFDSNAYRHSEGEVENLSFDKVVSIVSFEDKI